MITHAKMVRTLLETIIECAPEVAPEARSALRHFNLLEEEREPKHWIVETPLDQRIDVWTIDQLMEVVDSFGLPKIVEDGYIVIKEDY
jgi:hypothetical protein